MSTLGFIHCITADDPSLGSSLVDALSASLHEQGLSISVLDLSDEGILCKRSQYLHFASFNAADQILTTWGDISESLYDWLVLLKLTEFSPEFSQPIPGLHQVLQCFLLASFLESTKDSQRIILFPTPQSTCHLLSLIRSGSGLFEYIFKPILLWWSDTRKSLSTVERFLRLQLPDSNSLHLSDPWLERLNTMALLFSTNKLYTLTMGLLSSKNADLTIKHRLSRFIISNSLPGRLIIFGQFVEQSKKIIEEYFDFLDPVFFMSDWSDANLLPEFFRKPTLGLDTEQWSEEEGFYCLKLLCPGLNKHEIDIRQNNLTLVIMSKGVRRLVLLPNYLVGFRCFSASLINSWLAIRFSA